MATLRHTFDVDPAPAQAWDALADFAMMAQGAQAMRKALAAR